MLHFQLLLDVLKCPDDERTIDQVSIKQANTETIHIQMVMQHFKFCPSAVSNIKNKSGKNKKQFLTTPKYSLVPFKAADNVTMVY